MLSLAACQAAPATPIATGQAPASVAAATQEELRAIEFRKANSLQADLEHVRAVSQDPRATDEFGIPLLPEESAELFGRAASADAIIEIVQAEAASAPDDYCGLYLDNAHLGAVTSGWKANRLSHELAIRSKVKPGAKVAFIDCRFSEPEVDRVCDLLRAADHDWMREIPAALQGYGCGNRNFRVEMSISSAVPNAAERVVAHYTALFGLPPGILVAESDGTGAVLLPWGEVRVKAVDANGEPFRDTVAGLLLVGLEGSGPGECGGGDVGYGLGIDGVGTMPCQVGDWTIALVSTWDQDTGWKIHGSARVTVRASETTQVTIEVKDPPTE